MPVHNFHYGSVLAGGFLIVMKTMIAKYPGTCTDCGEPIKRGEPICFFGRGHAEHQSCTQARQGDTEKYGDGEDERAGLEPGTLASDRRAARSGLSVVRFSSGHVMTQNSRGRCEDAPCCGCCS
jgi:hypothetical protein